MQMSSSIPNATNTCTSIEDAQPEGPTSGIDTSEREELTFDNMLIAFEVGSAYSDRSRLKSFEESGPPTLAVMPARDSHAENVDGLAEDLDPYGVRNAFASWLALSSDDLSKSDISSTSTFTTRHSTRFQLDLDQMIDETLERLLENERSPAIQMRRMPIEEVDAGLDELTNAEDSISTALPSSSTTEDTHSTGDSNDVWEAAIGRPAPRRIPAMHPSDELTAAVAMCALRRIPIGF